jgi:hypothetical protein
MPAARLALACLAALLVAAPADAATRPTPSAPTGLHGFLLRADERRTDTFARTPSFAWNPVAGALRYELQVSTSSQFREGGIVYENEALTSPAAEIRIALPWITGNPYSLYARVRAVLPKAVTGWSRAYGFNMRWPSLPTPIETYPGLLRWTPVEGATAYTVWYLFPNGSSKQITVYTNVIDQREWYTFHQGSSFSGQVKWRIRAIRRVYGSTANGIPGVSYGPWSPIYTTKNPAFTGGPMTVAGTVSDALSTPAKPDAHGLMPAFLYTGNRSIFGQASELYRVYVFTDRDCINPVFKGALVGSPAYAPRPFGTIALPTSDAAVAAARTQFLPDGSEPFSTTFDLERVESTESLPAASPYTPKKKTPDPTTGTPTTGDDDEDTGTAGATIPVAATPAAPAADGFAPPTKVGAPVDLWDTAWPEGRYYWTVVPVSSTTAGSISIPLAAAAAAGATSVTVGGSGLAVGDKITIGSTPSEDRRTIVGVSGGTVELSAPLQFAHGPGEPVARSAGGALEYRDLELTQEACASGRVATFGKTSEPVVTAASAPYASGLSTNGRLVAAASRVATFYGTPVVAWAPALGAGAYEVQWSKTRYPFRAAADSVMTYSTAVTLPLRPGTWFYRVRGINYSVPTGAQPMSWSDPVEVRIAKPRFRVVGSSR